MTEPHDDCSNCDHAPKDKIEQNIANNPETRLVRACATMQVNPPFAIFVKMITQDFVSDYKTIFEQELDESNAEFVELVATFAFHAAVEAQKAADEMMGKQTQPPNHTLS